MFGDDVALGQHEHGAASGVEVGEVLALIPLHGEGHVDLGDFGTLGEDDLHCVILSDELSHVAREGNLETVGGGIGGEEGVEGKVVSSIPVVLPPTEEGETGDDVEFEALGRGGEGGGGDVADVIAIVDVRGLSGEDLSDLKDGCGAASRVPLEVKTREVTLIK